MGQPAACMMENKGGLSQVPAGVEREGCGVSLGVRLSLHCGSTRGACITVRAAQAGLKRNDYVPKNGYLLHAQKPHPTAPILSIRRTQLRCARRRGQASARTDRAGVPGSARMFHHACRFAGSTRGKSVDAMTRVIPAMGARVHAARRQGLRTLHSTQGMPLHPAARRLRRRPDETSELETRSRLFCAALARCFWG
jgi:hypothetical protein